MSEGDPPADGIGSGDGVSTDGVPDFVGVRDHVREELVRFVRALRRAGVAVPANAGTDAARALVVMGLDDRDRARAALRACLVADHDDVPAFDRLFGEFWRRLTAGLDADGPAPRPDDPPEGRLAPIGGDPAPGDDPGDGDDPRDSEGDDREPDVLESFGGVVGADDRAGGDEAGDEVTTARYSPTGSRSEVAGTGTGVGFDGAFRELTRAVAGLRGRRWATGGDERADVRRALRSSFGTGGTVVSVPGQERTRTAVRAVLLADVSRSVLDTVDRDFLVSFLARARADWRDARVFLFDEDLRDVTDAFDAGAPDRPLAALRRAEAEWGGGTRIARSLERLRTDFPGVVDNRTVVFVISDGLEMGDVEDLERELSWLSRRAGPVLWCNPLAGSSAYEPTARGMAAALPYVDGLFAFARPDDVAEIARQLRRQGVGGRIGYEYDPRRGDS